MRYQILCAAAIIAAILVVGGMDYEDAKRQESDYCASVKEWAATNGHGGHPDYDGIAGEACREKK